jgi:hypothetical protein
MRGFAFHAMIIIISLLFCTIGSTSLVAFATFMSSRQDPFEKYHTSREDPLTALLAIGFGVQISAAFFNCLLFGLLAFLYFRLIKAVENVSPNFINLFQQKTPDGFLPVIVLYWISFVPLCIIFIIALLIHSPNGLFALFFCVLVIFVVICAPMLHDITVLHTLKQKFESERNRTFFGDNRNVENVPMTTYQPSAPAELVALKSEGNEKLYPPV